MIDYPEPAFMADDEIRMLTHSVGRFFDQHAPQERIQKWREDGMVERAFWNEAGAAGLLGVSMPVEYGGAGGDFRHEMALIERALEVTIQHVIDRKAFGKRLIDFQNTQFKLAECKTEATIARVFLNHCIQAAIDRTLDDTTAAMAKYWITDLENKVIDECLQLHGGYGYINEYPIARMFRDARISRIFGGANEIMKMLIARSFTPRPDAG